jgi:hypothetical protein
MKNLLLVFVVLLFLLTLLSSFGGSIRTEPFYDGTPPAITSVPSVPIVQQSTSGAATSTTPTSGAVYNQTALSDSIPIPSTSTVVQSTVSPTGAGGAGGSEEVVPSLTNKPTPPVMPNMTIPSSTNSAAAAAGSSAGPAEPAEHYINYEKVDVPAPFFDKDFGAPV